MFKFLHGNKTYLTAAASVAYAVLAYYTGHMSSDDMVQMIQAALLGCFIRHGMKRDTNPGDVS